MIGPEQTAVLNPLSKLEPPIIVSVISDIDTPVSVYNKLSTDANCAFLFESTEGDSRLARFSFVGVEPLLTVQFRDGLASVFSLATGNTQAVPFTNPLDVLKQLLNDVEAVASDKTEPVPFPFTGGFVGFMGYAATKYFEQIPQQDSDPHCVPEGYYGLYDSFVVFDHQFRKISVVSRRGKDFALGIINKLVSGAPLQTLQAPEVVDESDFYRDVQTAMPKGKFLGLVDKCKEYIREGQVFQIVVSQRFTVALHCDDLNVYRVLQSINPSPYAYILKFPDFSYIGSSPETFVRVTDGQVMLRAIAGTRPRGITPEQDTEMEKELRSSEKEMAEHHMLVDLGRNDLGRICNVGTIVLGEIASLTRYTHVMHLSTEITGTLRTDKTAFDAFRSCFPRGTVSGAPKVRAMQLLSQLEPECRGVYSGVVGYFDLNGNTDGAIAIRSALLKDSKAQINAGAGIVLDSDPEAEYEETRNKAKSVIKAVLEANRLSKGAR